MEINKAKQFRDKFQDRDDFRNIIAEEMGVSTALVRKLQKLYREHQNRMEHTARITIQAH